MFGECALWALTGLSAPVHARLAVSVQLTPAVAMAGVGATLAGGLLWLLVTFLLGRVYCSAFCPLGVLQDGVIRLRSLFGRNRRRFSYRKSNNRRFLMLGIYAGAMVAAIGCVPLLLEPLPAFINALSVASFHGPHPALKGLGVGAALGTVCAVVSMLGILCYSFFWGRDFCNEVCPVGTVLRLVGNRSVVHMELEPDKCTACLKCQDVCKASCIDIKTRTIDNGPCVRCFDCLAVCDDDALHFTIDRNGVASPLFQRRRSLTP